MDSINLKNYFFYFASFVVIIAGVKMSSQVVVILFLAIFISSIFSTLLKVLQKKHIPRLFSYFIILLIVVGIGVMLAYVINISLNDFLTNLPTYEEKLKNTVLDLLHLAQNAGIQIDKTKIMGALNFNSFFGFTTNIIGSIGTFLSKFLLVVIGVAFILAESKSFQTKLRVIFRNNAKKLEHFNLFSFNIQKYFVVKSFTSFLTGFIITIVLTIFGVDYPILWGVIAMLFNFVPVVGSIIASIPAILLTFMNLDINITIWVIILYVVINISISNILEPKLMGRELGLSPLVIFFSLIFWGYILGIVGMFLAVPITMTLKIAFDSNTSTHWLGILMSDLSRKKVKSLREQKAADSI
ncbi:AI-2E family transporter [Arcobacter sp. s6]|uniref:AI-2E family transporter n=1 Tax=Arcobacter sp. s6 TaxID=3230363 RepID=UPI00349FEBD3